MRLLQYTNFGAPSVNENIQQSKKFLKDRYVQYKIYNSKPEFKKDLNPEQLDDLKAGVGNIKLTDFSPDHQEEIKKIFRETKVSEDEVRRIERHPDFIKIKEMLGDRNFGYAYMFVYFHFVEKLPMEECKRLFANLQRCQDLLSRLRRPIATFIDPNVPNNAENLADDLVRIDHYRAYKKFINELLPELKKEEPNAPVAVKRKLEELAVAFDEIGKNHETGVIDEEVRRSLQKIFFEKVKRWHTLRELIVATENYLKGVTNGNMSKFYQLIENCNSKFGNYGAEICYDEANILVLEIRSFAANRMLNSNTSHCIKDSQSYWDSYVGGETNYNKQYYIYNFNLGPSDNNSIIGITIEPGQGIRACHDKRDGGMSSTVKSLFNKWEKELGLKSNTIWSHLQPMSKAEIELKKRRVVANREIVKPGLTINQIKKYITEDGADPNAGSGQALHNAVMANDLEKSQLLLDLGASPNLRFTTKGRLEATIAQAQDIEMIKLLVSYGCELTQEVFKKINDDYDAIKYCLEQGLDPNFDNGLALRLACRSGNIESIKLVIEYGANWKDQKNMPLCWAAEHGKKNVIEWLWEKGLKDGWERPMNWLQHSRKLTSDQKIVMLDWLQTFLDEGKVTISDEAKEIQKKGNFKKYKDYVMTRIRPEKSKKA